MHRGAQCPTLLFVQEGPKRTVDKYRSVSLLYKIPTDMCQLKSACRFDENRGCQAVILAHFDHQIGEVYETKIVVHGAGTQCICTARHGGDNRHRIRPTSAGQGMESHSFRPCCASRD